MNDDDEAELVDGPGEYDVEPELAGYEPHDRPLRRSRRSTTMRVVVIVGLLALVLPGILVTVITADRTAQTSCAAYTQYFAPEAVGSEARFDLFGPSIGWNCYAQFFGGNELVIATLGLIPGGRPLPTQPLQDS
jgi:hypothetical protein